MASSSRASPDKQQSVPTSAPTPVIPTDPFEYYDAGNHWCQHCNVTSGSMFDFFTHLHSKSHRKTQDPYSRPWASTSTKTEKNHSSGEKMVKPAKGSEFLLPVRGFYCEICEAFYGDAICAEEHVTSHAHNEKYKKRLYENPLYEQRRNLDRQAGVGAKKHSEIKRKHEDESRDGKEKEEKSKHSKKDEEKSKHKKKKEEDQKAEKAKLANKEEERLKASKKEEEERASSSKRDGDDKYKSSKKEESERYKNSRERDERLKYNKWEEEERYRYGKEEERYSSRREEEERYSSRRDEYRRDEEERSRYGRSDDRYRYSRRDDEEDERSRYSKGKDSKPKYDRKEEAKHKSEKDEGENRPSNKDKAERPKEENPGSKKQPEKLPELPKIYCGPSPAMRAKLMRKKNEEASKAVATAPPIFGKFAWKKKEIQLAKEAEKVAADFLKEEEVKVSEEVNEGDEDAYTKSMAMARSIADKLSGPGGIPPTGGQAWSGQSNRGKPRPKWVFCKPAPLDAFLSITPSSPGGVTPLPVVQSQSPTDSNLPQDVTSKAVCDQDVVFKKPNLPVTPVLSPPAKVMPSGANLATAMSKRTVESDVAAPGVPESEQNRAVLVQPPPPMARYPSEMVQKSEKNKSNLADLFDIYYSSSDPSSTSTTNKPTGICKDGANDSKHSESLESVAPETKQPQPQTKPQSETQPQPQLVLQPQAQPQFAPDPENSTSAEINTQGTKESQGDVVSEPLPSEVKPGDASSANIMEIPTETVVLVDIQEQNDSKHRKSLDSVDPETKQPQTESEPQNKPPCEPEAHLQPQPQPQLAPDPENSTSAEIDTQETKESESGVGSKPSKRKRQAGRKSTPRGRKTRSQPLSSEVDSDDASEIPPENDTSAEIEVQETKESESGVGSDPLPSEVNPDDASSANIIEIAPENSTGDEIDIQETKESESVVGSKPSKRKRQPARKSTRRGRKTRSQPLPSEVDSDDDSEIPPENNTSAETDIQDTKETESGVGSEPLPSEVNPDDASSANTMIIPTETLDLLAEMPQSESQPQNKPESEPETEPQPQLQPQLAPDPENSTSAEIDIQETKEADSGVGSKPSRRKRQPARKSTRRGRKTRSQPVPTEVDSDDDSEIPPDNDTSAETDIQDIKETECGVGSDPLLGEVNPDDASSDIMEIPTETLDLLAEVAQPESEPQNKPQSEPETQPQPQPPLQPQLHLAPDPENSTCAEIDIQDQHDSKHSESLEDVASETKQPQPYLGTSADIHIQDTKGTESGVVSDPLPSEVNPDDDASANFMEIPTETLDLLAEVAQPESQPPNKTESEPETQPQPQSQPQLAPDPENSTSAETDIQETKESDSVAGSKPSKRKRQPARKSTRRGRKTRSQPLPSEVDSDDDSEIPPENVTSAETDIQDIKESESGVGSDPIPSEASSDIMEIPTETLDLLAEVAQPESQPQNKPQFEPETQPQLLLQPQTQLAPDPENSTCAEIDIQDQHDSKHSESLEDVASDTKQPQPYLGTSADIHIQDTKETESGVVSDPLPSEVNPDDDASANFMEIPTETLDLLAEVAQPESQPPNKPESETETQPQPQLDPDPENSTSAETDIQATKESDSVVGSKPSKRKRQPARKSTRRGRKTRSQPLPSEVDSDDDSEIPPENNTSAETDIQDIKESESGVGSDPIPSEASSDILEIPTETLDLLAEVAQPESQPPNNPQCDPETQPETPFLFQTLPLVAPDLENSTSAEINIQGTNASEGEVGSEPLSSEVNSDDAVAIVDFDYDFNFE